MIELLAKTFFRHVGQEWKKAQTAEGREKKKGKNNVDRRRARRSAVRFMSSGLRCRPNQVVQLTHDRRRAAAQFEQLWGAEGVDDLLDTDYASSILSCDEDDLSEDSKNRRRDTQVGQGANMARGKKWRMKKVGTHRGLF